MSNYPRCEALRRTSDHRCGAAARDGHVHDLEGVARRVCPLHWRIYHAGDGAVTMRFARRHPEYAQ